MKHNVVQYVTVLTMQYHDLYQHQGTEISINVFYGSLIDAALVVLRFTREKSMFTDSLRLDRLKCGRIDQYRPSLVVLADL